MTARSDPEARTIVAGVAEDTAHASTPDRIGRYEILGPLGHGGMGAVYRARDGTLGRQVAIKLLHAHARDKDSHGRARLLREAQALAQLSHPGVVSVFEAGVHEGVVYLVMELIEGQTLGAWLDTRPDPAQIMRVLRQAGQGLAAAHAAGIVHRDFKPANVMLGDDGRTRVVDFGLARGTHASQESSEEPGQQSGGANLALITEAGTVVGTPAYMAPEQHFGDAVDGRADQFAFCIVAWEALTQARPFQGTRREAIAAMKQGRRISGPGGPMSKPIRRALDRGLAFRPAERWPSMVELLEALSQRSRRGRGVMVLGAVATAVVGAVAVAFASAPNEAPCDANAQLETVWNDGRRAAVQAGLLETGASYAEQTWARVDPAMAAYFEGWSAAYARSCEMRRSDPDAADRQMSCLKRRLEQASATIDVLRSADAAIVGKASSAVSKLEPVAGCETTATAHPTPQARPAQAKATEIRAILVRVDALDRAGDFAAGLELAQAVEPDARELGFAPVTAEVNYAIGHLLARTGKDAEAQAPLEEAYWTATEAQHDAVAVKAARRLLVVVGSKLERFDEGHTWYRHAQAALQRAPMPELRAKMAADFGLLRKAEGELEEAEGHIRDALEQMRSLRGEDHLRLGSTLLQLGAVLDARGRLAEALEVTERARDVVAAAAGPDHPDVGLVLNNIGSYLQRLRRDDEAVEVLRRSHAILDAALGPADARTAMPMVNLGSLYYRTEDLERAQAAFEQALAIQTAALGPDHTQVAGSLGGVAIVKLARNDLAGARAAQTRVVEILERALGADHPRLAAELSNLGAIDHTEGDLDQAALRWERALAIEERALGPDHPKCAVELHNLATIDQGKGRTKQAIARLERAAKIRETRLGPDHPQLADTKLTLAKALWADGRHDDARAAAHAAAAIHQAAGEAGEKGRGEVDDWLKTH